MLFRPPVVGRQRRGLYMGVHWNWVQLGYFTCWFVAGIRYQSSVIPRELRLQAS